MTQGRGRSDPDVLAMTLYMSVILRESIEMAGAVRDLVYHALTQERRFIARTTAMFDKAADAASRAPDDIGRGFAAALAAAVDMQDPAAAAITEVVCEQVENSTAHLPYYGANQAVAAAFAAASPDEAADMAGGRARLDHFGDLARVFRACMRRGPAGWPLKDPAGAAFERASGAAASRAARAAVADCGNVFAVAAAAQAVLVERIPDRPRRFLEREAAGICGEISAAISRTGAPQERASEITAAMLDGARWYPHDGAEASGEVAVRAVRVAHHRAPQAAARAAFCAAYSLAAGGAWTAAPDRDRFESAHGRALDSAAGVDRMIRYAFDKLKARSWKEPPFEDAYEDMWEFFSGASGLSVSEWAGMAQKADYRAAATAAENAALIKAYARAHDGALGAAGRAASKAHSGP